MKIIKIRIYVPILYMIVIFILSSIPTYDGKLGGVVLCEPKLTNILHVPAFAVLSFLWMWYFQISKVFSFKKAVKLVSIITITSAVFGEVYQLFIPGRFASVSDIALNIAGIFFGVLFRRK